MTIPEYLANLNRHYKTGISTEHTYRSDLQVLLESLAHGVQVTNEPSRVACGAPDYILTRKNIPVGYIEAKDIGVDLKGKNLQEQFNRYRASLDNLIITDYLDFHLYVEGEHKTSLKIAEIQNGKLKSLPENFTAFENLIKDFCAYLGQTIKSPKKLAEMMAAKAKLLATVIENALADAGSHGENGMVNEANNTLRDQLTAFKQILIHDIAPKEFADIYAQTIAYGMFAARLHDTTLDTFTRQEAAELIPKSNPFLRKLFQYVAGYDLDSRISWIVDGLADVFRATDVATLLKNFGSTTKTQDPIIHFYETFLTAYDPALRKARGVWYTPEPIVEFIVRAIDYILITEFGIADGLANNSMTTIKVNVPGVKNPVEKQVHRVQFLDPATGTATFLTELIKQIYSKFKGQEGIWSDYVEKHLIPRLNGFEILMASYAMAHLKLDLLLKETGYVPKSEQRLRIYLTNSLEEYHADTGTLFANWLSAEANEANHVKRDTPVMVVLGNPPYSVSSANKGAWIQSLIAEYKTGLNEKKLNLDDDYIKFIRYGQYFIEKNGEGILAFISNNSFIDGITHRQMRKHLLATFDKVYILDLHGNAKKKETAPDGGKDENVFDIMQGVSINIFIKKFNHIGTIGHNRI
ncbi:MAG: N-6 DNA methylase [Eubacteriales bacterium]